MKILLDTSFILTCLKEKIDFLNAEEFGELILPVQTINELKKVERKAGKERILANLALQIIEKNKEKFEFIELSSNYVDEGILKCIENNKDEKFVVATVDKGLKRKLKKMVRLLIIRAKKKLELE